MHIPPWVEYSYGWNIHITEYVHRDKKMMCQMTPWSTDISKHEPLLSYSAVKVTPQRRVGIKKKRCSRNIEKRKTSQNENKK